MQFYTKDRNNICYALIIKSEKQWRNQTRASRYFTLPSAFPQLVSTWADKLCPYTKRLALEYTQ